MKCPTHECDLDATDTRWGPRYQCGVEGCTVASWGGLTSTPATAEVRDLRRQCHELFDRTYGPQRRFRSRNAAYRWLAKFMGLPRDLTHIGYFDKESCLKLLAELAAYRI